MRAIELQERILDAAHSVVHPRKLDVASIKTNKEYFLSIRRYLIKASDCGLLDNSPSDVRSTLAVSSTRKGMLLAVGAVRNYNRVKSLPHFTRKKDGAWFDFQMELSDEKGAVEVLWYDFELRLPPGSPVGFVRIDFNPKDHRNEERALRSHIHVGSDDDGWSMPTPILSPYEALDVFLHGLAPLHRVRRLGTVEAEEDPA